MGWVGALAAVCALADRAPAAPPAAGSAAELAAEFERFSGARLLFEAAALPGSGYHDVMVPLTGERRAAAAAIALREVKKYPPGYLGAIGLDAIGVFAACVSKEGDGFRPYDKALGGYRYFGIWNGKDGIAAAYYGDSQLPLTLHHEIFHHVDGTVSGKPARSEDDDARFALALAGLEGYATPALSAADRAALAKRARGVLLEGAVSDYAAKSPGEDQAETARHFMSELPDALLQVAAQPELAGSQRMLHVMAEYAGSLPGGGGPSFQWWVDVALGRAGGGFEAEVTRLGAAMRARIEPQSGRFVVWGGEDSSGVNWTLRADVTGFGVDAKKLGVAARRGGVTDARLTHVMLERVRLLGRYLGHVGGNWQVSAGTRRVFELALAQHLDALPASRAMLAGALRSMRLEDMAELLGDDVLESGLVTARVIGAAAARGVRVNPYLHKVDAEVTDAAARAAVRAVQPATVRIGGGSGVNLTPAGRILTAGHVPKQLGARLVAQFPDGRKLETVCTAFDARWDLAVMSVVGAADLPYAPLAAASPGAGSEVIVIGQPGSYTPDGDKTGYQPFHVSTGHLRGLLKDVFGAQALGAAKHDAWTYWGHSGSPLFDPRGNLVAIHNSWDSTTAMRHAVPHQVIVKFLARERVPFASR